MATAPAPAWPAAVLSLNWSGRGMPGSWRAPRQRQWQLRAEPPVCRHPLARASTSLRVLAPLQDEPAGHTCGSLRRASRSVKRQLMVMQTSLRSRSKADSSRLRVASLPPILARGAVPRLRPTRPCRRAGAPASVLCAHLRRGAPAHRWGWLRLSRRPSRRSRGLDLTAKGFPYMVNSSAP